ncbi:MAG TPA: outer membrane beta-barrel protein [Bryobacteraceae bacterium]|nr:outer membrane beta-barrel protein [Bryobacteraceae bacterium]
MNFRTLVFVSALLAPVSAFCQLPISLGIKGGGALTDAFSDRSATVGGVTTRTYSPQGDYIVGPMLELHLPMGISAEVDALYRPLHLRTEFASTAGSFSGPGTVNSWEFPILAKYHFGIPFVKPFIEAGPSFRHVSQFAGDTPHLSTNGLALGAGVEAKALFVRIAPEFRYTHWGTDSNRGTSPFTPSSNPNQVEFLIGISF